MLELLLIAQVQYQYLTDANYQKVKSMINTNKSTTEQQITATLGKPPTKCGQNSFQKNCYWREGKRKMSFSWRKDTNTIMWPSYDGFL